MLTRSIFFALFLFYFALVITNSNVAAQGASSATEDEDYSSQENNAPAAGQSGSLATGLQSGLSAPGQSGLALVSQSAPTGVGGATTSPAEPRSRWMLVRKKGRLFAWDRYRNTKVPLCFWYNGKCY